MSESSLYQLSAQCLKSSAHQLAPKTKPSVVPLTICIKTTSSLITSVGNVVAVVVFSSSTKYLINSTALGYSYITFAAIQFVLLRVDFWILPVLLTTYSEIVVFAYSVVIISLKSLTICVQINHL